MAQDQVHKYVKRQSNGTYYVRKYLGTNPVTGRKLEAYKTLAAHDLEGALAEAREYLENLGKNPLLTDAFDKFILTKERMRAPTNTVSAYKTRANYLRPYIGSIRVRDLATPNVNDAYLELLDHGSKDGKPLASTTVRAVNDMLSAAYKWFIAQGLADDNPTDNATLPPKGLHEARPLDDAYVSILLAAIRDRLKDESTDEASALNRTIAFAARMTLYTGLRVGELCGLRHMDVRAASSDLHVCGTVVLDAHGNAVRQPRTKGKRSRNLRVEPADLAAIRAHVTWQRRLFPVRPESPLASVDGSFLRTDVVSSGFRRWALSMGLPDWCTYHTLRHTHASMLLARGVEINTVQERLGHASASTTLNIYGHVMPGRDQVAASQIHDVMGMLGGD